MFWLSWFHSAPVVLLRLPAVVSRATLHPVIGSACEQTVHKHMGK